jgi:hypothetical protein
MTEIAKLLAEGNGPVVCVIIEIDGHFKTIKGRAAWALSELIFAGKAGITSLERPAPRLAHYVFLLRRSGIVVETLNEGHGGPFSGHHARYILRTPLRVVDVIRQHDTNSKRKDTSTGFAQLPIPAAVAQ